MPGLSPLTLIRGNKEEMMLLRRVLLGGFMVLQAAIAVSFLIWGCVHFGFEKMLTIFMVTGCTAALEIKWEAYSKLWAIQQDIWREIWK